MKFYYTYVLLSKRDSKLYIGWRDNLKHRLTQHNAGQVISTAERRPLILIYFEACLSQEEAIKREKYFKTGFGRLYLHNRLGLSRVAGGATWNDPTKTPEQIEEEKKAAKKGKTEKSTEPEEES